MKKPASKETLVSLTQNSKDTIAELEDIFPAMVKLHKCFINAEEGLKDKSGTILTLFSKTEDLYMGSFLIMHELMASFRLLLSTTIIYEKRYHIQNITLTICEAYKYYAGIKENEGIWNELKRIARILENPILNSYINIIDKELVKLKPEKEEIAIRNCTSHYNNPIERYTILNTITEEDKYCKFVSQYMLLHLRISQISTIILAIISQFTASSNADTNQQLSISQFNVKDFLYNKFANKLSGEQLIIQSDNTLIKLSDSIDKYYCNHLQCRKIKEFLTMKYVKIPTNIEILNELTLLRMMVSYIQNDLICAVKAYMSSESKIERSLHLRKIFITEIAALTKLYGYNMDARRNSLWKRLKDIDINHNKEESALLEKKLDELTKKINNDRKNLYIHFIEKDKFNIWKRYSAYEDLNQIDEINKTLNLLQICKEIDDYTFQIVIRIQNETQQKTKKQNEHFDIMRMKIKNSQSTDEIKTQLIKMLDEIEAKMIDLLS
ncbi:MAG: hypothetical protein PUB21_10935 [Bacteroidales bacterium]|nr:hypothetical protein [Bacteroidales bacterium]